MATTMIDKNGMEEMVKRNRFVVIHPLDDAPEEKVDTAALGPMAMTRSVKLALFSLRGYLVLMLGLVVYHVCGQAGFFGLHVK